MIDPRLIEGSPERAALPPPGAPWREIETWCASIAGPDGDGRPIDKLAAIARQVQADMSAADIGSLLAAAYFAWRSVRWNDDDDPSAVRAISAVIEELRRRRPRPAAR